MSNRIYRCQVIIALLSTYFPAVHRRLFPICLSYTIFQDHVERGLQGGGHAIYDPFTVRLLIPERAILGVATIEAIACGSGASLRLSRVEAAVCENIILVSGGFEAVLTALVATYDVLAAEQRK